MEGTGLLVDLMILLVLAKIASEVAERLSLPGVVGEILAGVVAGPSLLGWVSDSDVLIFLGELGVILLLLEVGLEMDLAELGAVGKAAMSVAVVGVMVPLVGGIGAGLALGMTTNEAIFVGAALTATSVGLTARVFGDLKALASVEACTVLGAAVADDVLGLVILTVVVRLVEVGSVNPLDVAWLVLVAVGFLVISTGVGLRLVPPAFDALSRRSRSAGTLVAVVVAFTLVMAELASLAKLAPIIGAFVAGICLAKSSVRHRIATDLGPISHVLVPVFFFRIGLEADLAQFADPKVLGLAAALMVVAVVGKMVAALAMGKAPGDRLLVGLGMLPRGEVGLIFATIGLQQDVFGNDVYAALLLVVLGTTLLAPPLLRSRLVKVRAVGNRASLVESEPTPVPAHGWLAIDHGRVELVGRPPQEEALMVALDAAALMDGHRPGDGLIDWLDALPDVLPASSSAVQARFGRLFREGGAGAWRFLFLTGVMRRALPELDSIVSSRAEDSLAGDALGALQWPRVAALHADGRVPALVTVVAALVLDAADGDNDAVARSAAAGLTARMGLGPEAVRRVIDLVADSELLVSRSLRMGVDRAEVRRLADHLGSTDRVLDLADLTRAGHQLDAEQRRGLDALVDEVRTALVVAPLGSPPAALVGANPMAERLRNEVASPSSRGNSDET